jgi:hypothetical protein
VASGINCGPHGGKNSKTKSWTISWLSFKTKVELGPRGGQVMSGDWLENTPSLRVSSGSPQNHWVTWLTHKAKTEDSMCLTDRNRSDQFGLRASGSFEVEDMRYDRKACVVVTRV